MAAPLDLHPASPEELIAAHENVHDIWNKGLDVDAHVQARLNSRPHQRATWIVGCTDGRVVVSLGTYPVQFQIRGEQVPGFAIGSVYTRPEYRGRGYAPQLVEYAEQFESERGMRMSILYSDIPQQYYAALGYQLCPALCGWCDPAIVENADAAKRLEEFDPAAAFDAMSQMYHDYHGGAAISIFRDAEYWQAMSSKFPHDRFYWLTGTDGSRRAYARLTPDPHGLRILDYACGDQLSSTLAELYRSLLSAAAEWKLERFGGWVPGGDVAAEFFDISDRETEITMIKPLCADLEFDAEIIAAVGRFCEFDHV